MKNCTEPYKESYEEFTRRVDAMLQHMVAETAIWCLENEKPFLRFSRQQIADFVGCSKDHVRRLEESALSKLRSTSKNRGKDYGRN